MLPRVYAPAQSVKVEVPRVSEEVPQLREETVGYVPQTEDCDVLTPALGTAGADGVLDGGVFRFERCV
jgi:hypothetical protein